MLLRNRSFVTGRLDKGGSEGGRWQEVRKWRRLWNLLSSAKGGSKFCFCVKRGGEFKKHNISMNKIIFDGRWFYFSFFLFFFFFSEGWGLEKHIHFSIISSQGLPHISRRLSLISTWKFITWMRTAKSFTMVCIYTYMYQ